ncbi:MAG: hypothetical protein GY756_21445 [bacterium]|nr:hypothetical protein [bacterium]
MIKDQIVFLKAAFKYAQKIDCSEKQGDSLMLLGAIYLQQARYEDAWYCYLDAYRLFNKVDIKLKMAQASEALGTLEYYAQMFELAVINLKDSLELYKELGEKEKIKEIHNILLTTENL